MPLESLAVAASPIVAGASKLWPFVGAVSVTDGAGFFFGGCAACAAEIPHSNIHVHATATPSRLHALATPSTWNMSTPLWQILKF